MHQITLKFEGKEYFVVDNNPSDEGFEFMWKEGNYACDCNRSLLIRRTGYQFPEMKYGHAIEMVDFKKIDGGQDAKD